MEVGMRKSMRFLRVRLIQCRQVYSLSVEGSESEAVSP